MNLSKANMGSATTPMTPGAKRLQLRTKRHQVSKACDSCRAHRIKCENGRPCLNCQIKNRVCTQQAAPLHAATTLSAAHKEIDQLRQKVLNLEQELQQHSIHPPPPSILLSTHTTPPPSQSASPYREYLGPPSSLKVPFWQGTFLRPPRSPHASWFGPSSLYDFVRRFSSGLSTRIHKYQQHQQHDPAAGGLLPVPGAGSATLLNTEEISNARGPSRNSPSILEEAPSSSSSPLLSSSPSPLAVCLTPTQEQYFVSLFWESYHTCVFPILDEAEFKEHHDLLWADGVNRDGGDRKPSALIDMVLAICMQIGVSALPPTTTARQGSVMGGQDATVAGSFYYRRSQSLLAQQLDSPTYATLQCYLLAAVYQCGGSFHNMVDGSVAQALRVAYMLGLHIDPASSSSSSSSFSGIFDEKECQRRRILWSAVYLLDSKVGMKFGRPFLIRDDYDYHRDDDDGSSHRNKNSNINMPQLPGHGLSAARLSGSRFGLLGRSNDISWLSFHVWHTKLYIVMRRAHRALYETDVGRLPGQDLWDSRELLDAHANILLRGSPSAVQLVESWAHSVPAQLTTPRQDSGGGGGKPFSTHGDIVLQLDMFAPIWLQRQRLLLEAAWHHQMASMFRVFITFNDYPTSPSTSSSSAAEQLASLSVSHAVAFTRLAHQVLIQSSLLDGWHEMFQWQWSSAMILAGYILDYNAFPSPATPAKHKNSKWAETARDVLPLAVVVLEAFGVRGFGIARDAARIVNGLIKQIDSIDPNPTEMSADGGGGGGGAEQAGEGDAGVMMQGLEGEFIDLEGLFTTGSDQDFLDMALGVDFWGEADALWPDLISWK